MLFLLLLIPVVFWYVWEMQRSDASLQISSQQRLKEYPKTLRLRLRHLPFVLRVLAIACVIVAVARPQKSDSWKTENTEGIDIVLALDISGSMELPDFTPNRLEAAKQVASEFIAGRPNDNIGLTVFAAEAFTQCPMTTDHAVLLNLFRGVGADMAQRGMIEDGTAVGMGIANAVSRLKDSKAKSKVIILLTDGTNNAGDISPMMAAEIAKSFGIRVYTIGVGTNGLAPYPMPVAGGVQYLNIPVEIDTKTLSAIAGKTDGEFYRATDNRKLEEVYKDIDKLEKTKLNVKQYSKRYEAYALFAWIAAISLLLEILLRATILKRIP